MKKLFCTILAVVMMLSVIPASVTTNAQTTSGGLEYSISDKKVSITGYSGSASALTIPSTIEGYPVTTIDEYAFMDCTSLKSITLPAGLKTIIFGAFAYCSSLASINIPSSVTYIGEGAFEDCSSLKSIVIPSSITTIGFGTFSGCSALSSITIPKSVTKIGDAAFRDTAYYKNASNWANNVLYIGDCLIEAKDTVSGSYTVKDGTRLIASSAFSDCTGLKSLTLPKSVKYINSYAFSDCSSLATVSYGGTDYLWKSVRIDSGNTRLTSAKISYTPCKAHVYDNKCDTSCNECNASRAITHTYKTTVAKATLSKNGSIVKKCTVCGNVASNTAIKAVKTVKLATTAYAYTGKVIKPAVTVKDSAGKTLKNGTDYTVKYATGCKNVGTYKVTVTFKGNYSGTKTLTFTINPQKITLGKVTGGKNTLAIAWTPKTAQVTGYEIQYSTNKNLSGAKKVTITKTKTKTTTVKKLTKGKTYYVRIRSFKTVNGKKFFSAWSAVKSAKIK